MTMPIEQPAAPHWAFDLIGRSHDDVGRCWGLVRLVFERRHGLSIPPVAVGEDDNLAAIRHAAELSGWRRAEAPAEADDVVMMRGPSGRHVGVMIAVDQRLRLLHATRVDGVVHQSLAEATADGYADFELWRRA